MHTFHDIKGVRRVCHMVSSFVTFPCFKNMKHVLSMVLLHVFVYLCSICCVFERPFKHWSLPKQERTVCNYRTIHYIYKKKSAQVAFKRNTLYIAGESGSQHGMTIHVKQKKNASAINDRCWETYNKLVNNTLQPFRMCSIWWYLNARRPSTHSLS